VHGAAADGDGLDALVSRQLEQEQPDASANEVPGPIRAAWPASTTASSA
jgi:hypothetical protein